MDFWAPLETEDPQIATLVHDEEERTRSNLELTPTCSRTPGRRPTWRSTTPSLSAATR